MQIQSIKIPIDASNHFGNNYDQERFWETIRQVYIEQGIWGETDAERRGEREKVN